MLVWLFGLYMWAPNGCSEDPLLAFFTWWRAHCCPRYRARCTLLHHIIHEPRGRAREDGISPFVHLRGSRRMCGPGDIRDSTRSHFARRCHSESDECWTFRTSSSCSLVCRLRGCATERATLRWATARGHLHSYRHQDVQCVAASSREKRTALGEHFPSTTAHFTLLTSSSLGSSSVLWSHFNVRRLECQVV